MTLDGKDRLILQFIHKMEDEGDYSGLESGPVGINLNGRNVGAVMVAPRDVDIASQSGCRINVYVNSNVQATCGSALIGSKVKLRDPGVHVVMEDVKMTPDEGARQKEMRLIKVGLGLVCLFNIFLLLILLLTSWFRKKTNR